MSDSFYNADFKIGPGVKIITASGDTVLTNPSQQYIIGNTSNISDYSITLPAVNQVNSWPLGSQIVIENQQSTININIKDSSGIIIAVLPATQIEYLYLTDNSTASGVWTVKNYSPTSSVVQTINLTFGTGTYVFPFITAPVTFQRFNGNTVSMTIPQLRATVISVNPIGTLPAIPSIFIPSQTRSQVYSFFDGTINNIGRCKIDTTGLINFYANTDSESFGAGGTPQNNTGPNGQAILYSL